VCDKLDSVAGGRNQNETLRVLRVEALLTTEGTETLRTAGKIFAAREEDEN
jgi:hypothetical protein